MSDERRAEHADAAPDAERADALEEALDEATEAVAVEAGRLDELSGEPVAGPGVDVSQLMDVPVRITVELGRVSMSLGQLVKLTQGSLIELEREAHEPADILVNGKVVARGEIVTIDDVYGVRITDVEG